MLGGDEEFPRAFSDGLVGLTLSRPKALGELILVTGFRRGCCFRGKDNCRYWRCRCHSFFSLCLRQRRRIYAAEDLGLVFFSRDTCTSDGKKTK